MASPETNPQLMKAAQLYEYNKPYRTHQTPIPSINDNELLIRVHAAGFCHSDLQVIQGQLPTTLPMIPSHEPAGTIVRVGSACSGTWKQGDRVGVLNFKHACGECIGCGQWRRKSGKLDPRFCERRVTAGFANDGAFAEFMAADPATTVKLPGGVSFQQAAPLMCAGVSYYPR